jgi:drug/metabolite transporter (DMT)-like permease
MKDIFIGRPLYWLLWAVVLGVLWVVGEKQIHTIHFDVFIAILLALSAGCVLVIVLTYREGERITREPFDDDGD